MAVPSSGPVILLWTFTMILSPQFASMSGPGKAPLTSRTGLSYPSGAMTPRLTVKSYVRITPVLGKRVYGLVPQSVS